MASDTETESTLSRVSNVLVEMTNILEAMAANDRDSVAKTNKINVEKIIDNMEMLETLPNGPPLQKLKNNCVYDDEFNWTFTLSEPVIAVTNKKKSQPAVLQPFPKYSIPEKKETPSSSTKAPSPSPPIAYTQAVDENLQNCLLVAGRGELNRFVIHMYLKRHGTWSSSQHIPCSAIPKRCCVFRKSSMYFIGGEGQTPKDAKSDKFYIYDIRNGAFTSGPSMRVSRCDATAILWKNNIYVTGGLNRLNIAMTHVEVYDTYLNTWQLMPPMKFKRHKSGITIMDGMLYLIGGFTVRCECYNVDQASGWLALPDLPYFCKDFSMFATNDDGRIMAIRSFRPDRVCVLQLDDYVWKVTRTIGLPPEVIRDTCKCFEELYAVDETGRIFVLNLKFFTWDQTITCPKTLSNVLHIATINFADQWSTSDDKVARDFELN